MNSSTLKKLKTIPKGLFAIAFAVALSACSSERDADASASVTEQSAPKEVPPSKPHRKRIVLENCDDAPADAVLNEGLSPEILEIAGVHCTRGIGHQLASAKGHVWMYRTISYEGFQVPDLALINANVDEKTFAAKIHEANPEFHKNYFTSIELEILDDSEHDAVLDKLREANPGKNITKRSVAQRLKSVNNQGVTQYVYLFPRDADEESYRKTIGFTCAPDCSYDAIFTKEVWVDASEITKELLKKYGPEARAREAAEAAQKGKD